jgi:hypothetical protein
MPLFLAVRMLIHDPENLDSIPLGRTDAFIHQELRHVEDFSEDARVSSARLDIVIRNMDCLGFDPKRRAKGEVLE